VNQINQFIESLLTVDFSEFISLFEQVVGNPLANLQASLLVLTAFVVLTLVAILVAIVALGFGDDDDEDEDDQQGDEAQVAPVHPLEPTSKLPPVPLTPEQRRTRFVSGVLFGTLVMAITWGLLGVTTGADTLCLSCHGTDMPHAERLADKGSTDPHANTGCIRCHEPRGVAASFTTNVPSRVSHVVKGIAAPLRASAYGTPVRSSSCESCHPDVGEETITVEERGVRVSHKEPLEAGATCVDCHEIQEITGSIGSWTVGMSACLRCHDNVQASADCGYCHTRDIAYAVHVNRAPEPKRLVNDKRCYTCHEQRACDSCHGLSMPHTQDFINREHPRVATLDNWYNNGNKCKRCHTDKRNPCTNCHDKGPFPGHPINDWPSVHGVNPGAGTGSCDTCHASMAKIQGRNFCGVCHEQYSKIR